MSMPVLTLSSIGPARLLAQVAREYDENMSCISAVNIMLDNTVVYVHDDNEWPVDQNGSRLPEPTALDVALGRANSSFELLIEDDGGDLQHIMPLMWLELYADCQEQRRLGREALRVAYKDYVNATGVPHTIGTLREDLIGKLKNLGHDPRAAAIQFGYVAR